MLHNPVALQSCTHQRTVTAPAVTAAAVTAAPAIAHLLLCVSVQMVLSKIRNAARTLLTMEDKDPKRIFEGTALMRRMYK